MTGDEKIMLICLVHSPDLSWCIAASTTPGLNRQNISLPKAGLSSMHNGALLVNTSNDGFDEVKQEKSQVHLPCDIVSQSKKRRREQDTKVGAGEWLN